MPHDRPRRSNDLVFIYLEEAYSYWEDDSAEMQTMRSILFKSPNGWAGENVRLADLIESLSGLAGKYHCRIRPLELPVGDVMVTGGEAFGIVCYAVDKALVSAHTLKATQETLPILKDLQDYLVSRWDYQDHAEAKLEKLCHRYTWSAVMSAQRIQGRAVTFDWTDAQMARINKTASKVLRSYQHLIPEFQALMAYSHMMHLGGTSGERIAGRRIYGSLQNN